MGKRILVADDSLTIQQAIAMVMEGTGYALSFAKTVDEALVVAKKDGRPDLVLADVALGNGSGYDLCAELKADGSTRDVPVFILASTQSPYDEGRGRKVGADGYMAKPFESQALLDAVASALTSPVLRPASAMPEFSDHNDNTARIAGTDLPLEDEDSYGEITIERGATSTPAAPAWGVKPAARPTGARPVVAPAPMSAPPAQPSPRPSLIPGARPSTQMPAVRAGSTPQPTAPAPSPAAARPAMARTMMGFPSVKPPVVAGRPQAPSLPLPPAPAPLPAAPPVAAPAPTKPTSPSGVPVMPAGVPVRAPMMGTPSMPSAPMVAKAPLPAMPTPATPTAPRPVVPRFSPPAAAPAMPSPVPRRAPTPVPPSVAMGPIAPAPSAPMAAMVSSLVDQKVSAIAARGPEYEAIAKLSREIIEQVVWEVVPELAETIIRQEIDRLAAAKK
jgi:CheY-like chemotaxis protein